MQVWLRIELILIVLALSVNGLSQILKRIQIEQNYESLLLLQSFNDDCWSEIQKNTSMPILNMNEDQDYPLKKSFNKRILAVACLRNNREYLLEVLFNDLNEMRSTPTLLLVDSKQNLSAIFEECRQHQMLNVLALRIASGTDRFIYSYGAFPQLKVKRRVLQKIRTFFEPSLKNLHQHTIIATPKNILPRCVLHTNAKGQIEVKGFLTGIVKNFVKKLNGSLDITLKYGKWPKHEVTASLMKNGSLDLLLSVINPAYIYHLKNDMYTYSDVLQIGKWSLMLPMEPFIERSSVYFNLGFVVYVTCFLVPLAFVLCNAQRFETGVKTFSLRCGIHLLDPILRGVTAQPIIVPKNLSMRLAFIYGLLFFQGLINVNIFTADLATFFLNPPTVHRIRSYQDMRDADIKIFLHVADINEMEDSKGETLLHNFSDLIVKTDSEDFQTFRSELNRSFAYPVTNTLWPLLMEEQKKLKRHVFRLSQEIQFIPFLVFVLPLAKNSIYEKAFNRYLLQIHSSGLYNYWFCETFNELKEIGLLRYLNKELTASPYSINFNDVVWIYLFYIIGSILSIIVFGLEFLYHKWTKQWKITCHCPE